MEEEGKRVSSWRERACRFFVILGACGERAISLSFGMEANEIIQSWSWIVLPVKVTLSACDYGPVLGGCVADLLMVTGKAGLGSDSPTALVNV